MPDKPTQSHSDPEKPDAGNPENSGEGENPGKKLRLKRVVIEDTEIKPSEDKNWAPVPEAQSYEEPEEEPVPIEPIPLTPEQIGELPPEQATDDGDDLEDEEEEEIGEESALSPAKRLALIIVPSAIICGIMVFLLKTYDPFGGDLSPIAPPNLQLENLAKDEAPAEEAGKMESTLEGSSLKNARTSLQDFLDALREQPLTASASPRGVFVDSVFIPEGAALNKQIGVVLSALLIQEDEALVVVTSPDGSKLTLPAKVNLR
jgi:hypothetical protein